MRGKKAPKKDPKSPKPPKAPITPINDWGGRGDTWVNPNTAPPIPGPSGLA